MSKKQANRNFLKLTQEYAGKVTALVALGAVGITGCGSTAGASTENTPVPSVSSTAETPTPAPSEYTPIDPAVNPEVIRNGINITNPFETADLSQEELNAAFAIKASETTPEEYGNALAANMIGFFVGGHNIDKSFDINSTGQFLDENSARFMEAYNINIVPNRPWYTFEEAVKKPTDFRAFLANTWPDADPNLPTYMMSGEVKNYSFTPNQDGSFTVNELSLVVQDNFAETAGSAIAATMDGATAEESFRWTVDYGKFTVVSDSNGNLVVSPAEYGPATQIDCNTIE